ncbi:hypothetical protein ASE01_12125 [Nocardioides sp. Root190]|nr:hypothetical protein ASE01_12125 [Nocardioides sp. Root190]
MKLSKGANAQLGGMDITTGLLVGLRWDSTDVEVNASAFVVGFDGQAISEKHFVYFNNPSSPEHSVWLLEPERSPVTDRAQIAISLADLPSRASKVIVTVATLDGDSTLASLTGLSARVLSLQSGDELISVASDTFGVESLVQVLEIYHHPSSGWKVRAVLQGYSSGLAGIATDLGIDVA